MTHRSSSPPDKVTPASTTVPQDGRRGDIRPRTSLHNTALPFLKLWRIWTISAIIKLRLSCIGNRSQPSAAQRLQSLNESFELAADHYTSKLWYLPRFRNQIRCLLQDARDFITERSGTTMAVKNQAVMILTCHPAASALVDVWTTSKRMTVQYTR